MKENSIKNERSSIEEDIKIALDKFSDNKDIDSAIFIVEKFILGNYILRGGRKNIVKDSLRYILSDYKRVLEKNEVLLKENERYKKSDYETICLENNELREITDRIQSEYNDLLKDNFKLKNELETKRKEYQETYKDVREELRELRKENEELKNQEATARRINELLVQRYSNSIPVQKVKDNIEKLKAQYKTALEKNSTEAFILKCQITILQELIKESEE